MAKGTNRKQADGPVLAFETQLWAAADKMRGLDAHLGPRNADSFRADLHPDLKADLVPIRKDLANPNKLQDASFRKHLVNFRDQALQSLPTDDDAKFHAWVEGQTKAFLKERNVSQSEHGSIP